MVRKILLSVFCAGIIFFVFPVRELYAGCDCSGCQWVGNTCVGITDTPPYNQCDCGAACCGGGCFRPGTKVLVVKKKAKVSFAEKAIKEFQGWFSEVGKRFSGFFVKFP